MVTIPHSSVVPFCVNKNEPEKSPAEDFFAWLHSLRLKETQIFQMEGTFREITGFHTVGLFQNLPQGFFLHAFAAFARATQKSKAGKRNSDTGGSALQVQKIPAIYALIGSKGG